MTDRLFFEDLSIEDSFDLGPKSVDREEVIAFAEDFDPQPFHLDEEAGRASILGGLSASGWHNCAMLMRMMYDSFLPRMASEGSPGLDFVKWQRPVLAGDTLSGRSQIIELRPSASRPQLGIAVFTHTLHNQRGEDVLSSRNPVLIRRRLAAKDPA
ncbi:MaoC family dehydratase [Pseudohoeflea coraliihabitans]|uniref:MaoC family dehydratase n=1 Tax=Pseudohoeflea coraliihabitans TaxID=2860393 RepID=A0ABS6WJI8_9HYPH|nr:MaoC family dehydratase [Pseudohoeflea sp. DP4N28-3]MBW3096111.1 MaoC family dehydratase [Pseudohoeflea sp. DP4N28-3]